MKKITAKYITENIHKLTHGSKIYYRGAEYFARPQYDDEGNYSKHIVYCISEDRRISGCVNGYEYGEIMNGVAYKY